MTAPRIEKLIEDLLKASRNRENYKTLLNVLQKARPSQDDLELLQRFLQNAFVRSALIGYALQAELFNEGNDVAPSRASSFLDNAQVKTEDTNERFDRVRRNLVTASLIIPWLDLVLTDATRAGVDTGMFGAASDLGSTHKTFVRNLPAKQPRAHSSLEGQTIPINEDFILPAGSPNAGQAIYGPRDDSVGNYPAEFLRCRHTLIYSRR